MALWSAPNNTVLAATGAFLHVDDGIELANYFDTDDFLEHVLQGNDSGEIAVLVHY